MGLVMKKLIQRMILGKAINIYYQCFEHYQYLMVTITKYRFNSILNIQNGFELTEIGKESGLIVSSGNLYGYVIFNYGYLILGTGKGQTHFGYSLFKSKTEKSNTIISTFCTYLPFTEKNIKEKINLLKYGENGSCD
jgi:hypothetical protein